MESNRQPQPRRRLPHRKLLFLVLLSTAPTTLPSTTYISRPDPNPGLYHTLGLFAADLADMKSILKIHIYPDALPSSAAAPFSSFFLPHRDPSLNPKLGNYFSEHMFKLALLNSGHVTTTPGVFAKFVAGYVGTSPTLA